MTVVVVMGVSGAGKSTLAGMLAARLDWDLCEGDDLHPPENIAKMAAGIPLTDADRKPWLERIDAWIREHVDAGRSGIVTCSALKRSYRDILTDGHDDVGFVYLKGSKNLIAGRLAARKGHFMPPQLLDSQFKALEPPEPDEKALSVPIDATVETIAENIIRRLGLGYSAGGRK